MVDFQLNGLHLSSVSCEGFSVTFHIQPTRGQSAAPADHPAAPSSSTSSSSTSKSDHQFLLTEHGHGDRPIADFTTTRRVNRGDHYRSDLPHETDSSPGPSSQPHGRVDKAPKKSRKSGRRKNAWSIFKGILTMTQTGAAIVSAA